MATLVLTTGYSWSAAEVVTATKLNSTGVPTIASGQSYTFAAGSAAAPSVSFTGGTTTGLYLGSSAIGFTVAGVSIATLGTVNGFYLSGTEDTAKVLIYNTTGGTGKNWYLQSSNGGNLVFSHSGVVNALILTPTSGNAAFASNVTVGADLIVTNLAARCSADFTISANTTLADITGLSVTLTAAGTYAFRAKLLKGGAAVSSAGGIKVAISGTCTATSIIASIAGSFGTDASGEYYRSVVTALNSAASNTPASSTSLDMTVEGCIVVNAGGTLTIQAAQVTASGTTTVGAGSTLWAQRIS